jgi:hypothetical protein
MTNPKFRYLLFGFLVAYLSASLLVGCTSEEFVTDPGSDLTFSVDTLSFDTLFSTVGSTTSWLRIRNKGNKAVRIASVSLKSGGNTGFHINLDGETGIRFDNVEIPAHDSLFLFVEVNTVRQGTPLPVQISDAILFDTDGPTKQIVLEAWSWDAVCWKGKTILSDTTLTSDSPILIYDSLIVAENTTLHLQPGTTLYFHDGAYMKVKGTLSAIGTREAPIRFRGDRLDYILPDYPYDYEAGQWYYLQLAPTSFNNRLEYVDIHGAYYGIVSDSSSLDAPKLRMFNSKIHNMVYSCIWSNTSDMELANCQLTNSGGYTVAQIGGRASYVHCTIANYQVGRDGPALILANALTDSKDTSLVRAYPMSADFRNCIVFGNRTDEVGFARRANIPWAATFWNCLLRASSIPVELASVNLCKYASDAHFLKLGSQDDKYVYDFRLDSISPARNIGSATLLGNYPNDINGISRATDGKPDAGAYEWIQGQK